GARSRYRRTVTRSVATLPPISARDLSVRLQPRFLVNSSGNSYASARPDPVPTFRGRVQVSEGSQLGLHRSQLVSRAIAHAERVETAFDAPLAVAQACV